jgi:hypothetical protein
MGAPRRSALEKTVGRAGTLVARFTPRACALWIDGQDAMRDAEIDRARIIVQELRSTLKLSAARPLPVTHLHRASYPDTSTRPEARAAAAAARENIWWRSTRCF